MKAKEILEKYKITRVTLCNWKRSGVVSSVVLPNGRFDYIVNNVVLTEFANKKNIIYSRVSTSSQKENLYRQTDRIKSFCSSKGIIVNETYEEIASALNYNRAFYKKLKEKVLNGEVDKIIIEYKDRLLRIGFEDFEDLCGKFNTEIIVLDDSYDNNKSKQQEITEDLISIIHHFSMKIYSSRKRKKIENIILKEEENNN